MADTTQRKVVCVVGVGLPTVMLLTRPTPSPSDCRNKDDGSWHNFNDSRVSGSSSSRLSGSAAYLLFFERTDGKLG